MSVPIHKKQEIKYKHSIKDIFFRIITLYSSVYCAVMMQNCIPQAAERSLHHPGYLPSCQWFKGDQTTHHRLQPRHIKPVK